MAKMDMTVVKDFFFNYGEKLALGVCSLITIGLVTLGLMSTVGAGRTDRGKPFAEEINARVKGIEASLRRPRDEGVKPEPPKVLPLPWNPDHSSFFMSPWMGLPDTKDILRRNPRAIGIYPEPDRFHFDVLTTGADAYEPQYSSKTAVTRGKYQAAAVDGKVGGPATRPMGPMSPMGEVGGSGQGQGLGAQPLAPGLSITMKPTRLVVVSASFPMEKQLEEFRKALRLDHMVQLAQPNAQGNDLPQFRGLIVKRVEVLPNGTRGKEVELYSFTGANGAPKLHKDVDYFLREVIYDEAVPRSLAPYIFPGLATPIPKLSYAKYKKVEVQGDVKQMEVAEGAPGAMDGAGPMGAGGPPPGVKGPVFPGAMKFKGGPPPMGSGAPMGQPGMQGDGVMATLGSVQWSKLPKDVVSKFEGKLYPFHPYGVTPPEIAKLNETKKGAPQAGKGTFGGPPPGPMGAMVPPGMMQPGGAAGGTGFGWDLRVGAAGGMQGPGMVPPGAEGPGVPMIPMGIGGEVGGGLPAGATNLAEDAIVRFIDPIAEPGKTYVYLIQIRIANPNYGRAKNEVAFAALADARELMPAPAVESPPVTIPGEYHMYVMDQNLLEEQPDKKAAQPRSDQTVMQIHRWFANPKDELISEWGVADRLLVRRGFAIGQGSSASREGVLTEVPVWSRQLGAFTVPTQVVDEKKGKAGGTKPGVFLEYIVDPRNPAILVDFDGGKRIGHRVANTTIPNEDASVDALILTSEGKLIHRNSRIDGDETTDNGKERKDRRDRVRERVTGARGVQPAANPGGFSLPGASPMNNVN